MAKKAATCSPLAAVAPIEEKHFQQREKPHTGKIILRGGGGDADFLAATEKTLKTPLPQTPNTTVKNGDDILLWLGANEWMLWTPPAVGDKRLGALQDAFAGLHAAAIDVSDYYTVIQLHGELARDVLMHGCPLDLRVNKFKTGDCAQSRFRNAPILLYKRDDTPTFDVQVRWSFADYLWHYFASLRLTLGTGE